MTWRIQYDYDADADVRAATDILCEDESLTMQDAPDADLNALVARMGINDGSLLPGMQLGVADPRFYGDFTDMPDLRSALDRLHDAEYKFADLPATIRNRFRNDPYELHAWVSDPQNLEEAVKLGLLHRTAAKSEPIAPVTQQTVANTPATGGGNTNNP